VPVFKNSANEPLQISEFKRPEKKVKKPTLEDKDPNVSDDEDGGRGRYRLVYHRVSYVKRQLLNVLISLLHSSI